MGSGSVKKGRKTARVQFPSTDVTMIKGGGRLLQKSSPSDTVEQNSVLKFIPSAQTEKPGGEKKFTSSIRRDFTTTSGSRPWNQKLLIA